MKAQLNSINLMAKEPAKLKDFYVNVFGLVENKERSHAPGFFFIEGGRGCNLLIQDAEAGEGEPGSRGFELGFEMDTVEGLEDKVVKSAGKVVNTTQQMGWGTAITVADLEGHLVNAYVFNKGE